jgi:hypothetical protein
MDQPNLYYSSVVTINGCVVAPRTLAFYFRSSCAYGKSVFTLFTGYPLYGLGLMIRIEMKSSTANTIASNNNLIKDVIGVILALVLGLGGQIFMLNPINTLTPKLPMLTQQDWPRSHVDQGLMISENWERPVGREFFIRLRITEKDYDRKAEIEQRTTWYANSTDTPVALARELQWGFPHTQLMAESSLSKNKPQSMLFCRNDLSPNMLSCTYLAYYEHWYTEVGFWSKGEEYLSYSEMERIIARVDQLLISAPDKP